MADDGASTIRIGAVTYLNARPLVEGLEAAEPRVRLAFDYPSVLAARLHDGALDLALIPSVEYLRGAADGLTVVPGVAIAARGAVRSVKLLSRVPFGRIGRLALDEGSRTSQTLARVWLAEVQGVRPESVESLPLGASPLESTADAVLVIGDRAMKVDDAAWPYTIDLGDAWNRWTGLPFVFALWVARPGFDAGELGPTLRRCRDLGLVNARAIARRHAPRLGLGEDSCVDYLTRSLSYELGPGEIAGLGLFARKAAALGLAPEGGSLVLAEPQRDRDLAARR